MNTVPVAILGTGKIGTDLLFKVCQSPSMHCACFVGRRESSEGMAAARRLGVRTSSGGIAFLRDHSHLYDIAFDATSAEAHAVHQRVFADHGKMVFDLTPSNTGVPVVPGVNQEAAFSAGNVSLISCGGQASLPLLHAISQVCPDIRYIEIVNTIASRSAGMGTRRNLDEYIHATEKAAAAFTGCGNVKALLLLNPADPPVHMHMTISVLAPHVVQGRITEAVRKAVSRINAYVPGYMLTADPLCGPEKVTVLARIEGRGDYLEKYAGNLDIITSAAACLADAYAARLWEKRLAPAGLQPTSAGAFYAKRKTVGF